MKIYFRLLSYAKPLEKFAVPYVICTLLSVLFATLNLALVIPLLHTLFNASEASGELLAKPGNWYDVADYFNYYAQQAGERYGPYGALKRVCMVIIASVLLSNVFRYLS